MITNPAVRVRRIWKLLERSGGGTQRTNTLSSFSPAVVSELSTAAVLAGAEEGLLAFYQGSSRWLLLTTERLVWKQGEKQAQLDWAEIHGVQQPPGLSAQLIRGELSEEAIEELEVFDCKGGRHLLRLEPGKGYYLVWSAITAFCDFVRPPEPVELEATGEEES